jgi:hypothetical protein
MPTGQFPELRTVDELVYMHTTRVTILEIAPEWIVIMLDAS